MDQTFSVDVRALGEIPALLERVRQSLGSRPTAEAPAATAAAAVAPGFGQGIAQFGLAVDAFAVAGMTALGVDADQIAQAAANYAHAERSIVTQTKSVTDQFGVAP